MTDIAAVDPVVTEPITTNPVVGGIEAALAELDAILRILPLPALSSFEPSVRAALGGVHAIAQATGLEPADTVVQQKFISHVTPGQPDAPELNG